MKYNIDLNLNRIWNLRAIDCKIKRKQITQIIKDIDFTNKAYYPLISIFVVNTNNNTRDFAAIVTGERLTYENTMLMLNTTIRNNYSSLFTNTEL